jgi:hypothetical protein
LLQKHPKLRFAMSPVEPTLTIYPPNVWQADSLNHIFSPSESANGGEGGLKTLILSLLF